MAPGSCTPGPDHAGSSAVAGRPDQRVPTTRGSLPAGGRWRAETLAMELAETWHPRPSSSPRMLVAPPWVLGCQPHDQGSHLLGNRWLAARLPWIGPAPAHRVAVPSKPHLGRDHEDRPSGLGSRRLRAASSARLEPRPWVAAQDGQLVTEDQDLHLPGVHRPPASTINSGTRRSAR